MLEAMESSVNGGFSQHLQSFGDSSEEELSILPHHTKVVVTGNNHTKSVLVGIHGVVKKAVRLGDWHWLVLTNGIEVKLQSNALSVTELPAGNEVDDDLEYSVQSGGCYSKPIQRETGRFCSRSISCRSKWMSSKLFEDLPKLQKG
ncbi:unnamed protein product [Lathyrus sativus]|nr:unnamed protein product [Lathyrus sativus]